jgi:hypothetical protein
MQPQQDRIETLMTMPDRKKPGSINLNINDGKTKDADAVKHTGIKTSCIKRISENATSRFNITSRTIKAAKVRQTAAIITEYAGAPNNSNTHETGKLNNNIPPTTDWYSLILPVAWAAVMIG